MKRFITQLAVAVAVAVPAVSSAQMPAVLQSFSTGPAGLFLNQFYWGWTYVPDAAPYSFGLWQFNGTSLVGSPLWQQAGIGPVYTADASMPPQVFTVALQLAPDTRYAVGFTAAPPAGVGFITQNACDPVNAAYLADPDHAGQYVYNNCGRVYAFGLNEIGPTVTSPEPATLALVGTGLLGVFAVGKRRRV